MPVLLWSPPSSSNRVPYQQQLWICTSSGCAWKHLPTPLPISTHNIWIEQDRAGATLQVIGEAVTIPLLSFSTFWRGAAFKLVLLQWQTGDRSKVESHPGCSSCSALGAQAPGAELDKPVRYFGEKCPGCAHCNRRLGKQGHRIELYVWRHKNCAPVYSSIASSAPGRKNPDASFLATTISWKNS